MPGERPLPVIDEARCNGCGDCVAACAVAALWVKEGKARLTRPLACDYCGRCEEVCLEDAIGCPYEIVVQENQATGCVNPGDGSP